MVVKLIDIILVLLIKLVNIIFVLLMKVLVGVILALLLKKSYIDGKASKCHLCFINKSADRYHFYITIENHK